MTLKPCLLSAANPQMFDLKCLLCHLQKMQGNTQANKIALHKHKPNLRETKTDPKTDP